MSSETGGDAPAATPYPLRAVPGYYARRPGIQIGSSIGSDATDEHLQFLQQLGVEWVMVNVNDPSLHSADYYRAVRERVARYGLQVYRIANHDVHNVPEITLGLPGRDEKIAAFCQFLRDLGAAGVRYHTYAHMGNGIWSSGHVEGRGGVVARYLDIADARGVWFGKEFAGALTHGRAYTEEEMWENFAYFLQKIVPVAEEAGVYVGIHPDDPPVYPLGGVPRCIFGTFDGYQRAMEMADSPHIGVCLCVGCWLEGGAEGMGCDVVEAVRYFGERGKLFKVHFRNVSNPMPAPWRETFIDDGYQDMYQVMRALRAVNFDGCIIPDHIPKMIGGHAPGLAYSIAYMKALAQAVSRDEG
jgi:mannonate dehydratase